MNISIIGGTNFIGPVVTQKLLDAGLCGKLNRENVTVTDALAQTIRW